MNRHAKDSSSAGKRRALYTFGNHNPYLPPERDLPLVRQNLARLRNGEISLTSFLRQTPHFPRWRGEQLQQARVMLVTNEAGLNDVGRLYGTLATAAGVEDVARCFRSAMLSWLSLNDHPRLGAINGEQPWDENGSWQTEHPLLAACGKAGYFLAPGEETILTESKAIHLELSPFAQEGGSDINPRNEQDQEYHEENREAVARFCRLATPETPRYIFIVANRATIRAAGGNGFRLEAVRSQRKDKSYKIVDLLRVVDSCAAPVHVRLCRRWPSQGCDADLLHVTSAMAYGLRPVTSVE